MENNCPSCGAPLGSYDKFFCSACGKSLPEQMIKTSKEDYVETINISEEVEKTSVKTKKNNSFKPKILIEIFALILLTMAVFLGFYFRDQIFDFSPSSENPDEVVVENSVSNPSATKTTTEPFLQTDYEMSKDFLSFESFVLNVPGDTDVYIYGLRLDEFSEVLLESFNIDLSTYISDIPSSSYGFIMKKTLDSDEFVWALLIRSAEEVIALGNTNFYEISDTTSAFSPSESFVKDIEDVSNKTVRNLRQSARLVLALGEYPEESRVGKIFIYTTENGKKIINKTCALEDNLVFGSFCNSNLNYAILR